MDRKAVALASELSELVGRTIADVRFDRDDYPSEVWFKFTDDTYAIFEQDEGELTLATYMSNYGCTSTASVFFGKFTQEEHEAALKVYEAGVAKRDTERELAQLKALQAKYPCIKKEDVDGD